MQRPLGFYTTFFFFFIQSIKICKQTLMCKIWAIPLQHPWEMMRSPPSAKQKSTRIQLKSYKENVLRAKKTQVILGFGRRCYWTSRGSLDGSVSVQQVQEHILILLSKLMIQTFSLDPDVTPLFHVTEAIGVKWTRSSSFPVIYFSFPVWQVALFCPQRPTGRLRYSPHCRKFSADGIDISWGCPAAMI